VRLLLTRPEADAQRTAAALRSRGHHVVLAPLLRIEPASDAQIGGGAWSAILVTSANAALARAEALHDIPVFAVGKRSAQAMRAAGFTDVSSADGDVNDLAGMVGERMKPGASLLYLTGEYRSGDLAGDLRARGYVVNMTIIYRAVAANALPPAAADALAAGIDGVLHFSRRTAEAYVNAAIADGLLDSAVKRLAHYCLSARVAEPLSAAGATDIRVSPRPVEATLIELIGAD